MLVSRITAATAISDAVTTAGSLTAVEIIKWAWSYGSKPAIIIQMAINSIFLLINENRRTILNQLH